MKTEEIKLILSIVEELNGEVYDIIKDDEIVPFGFNTNGYSWNVTFLEIAVFDCNDSMYDDNDNILDIKSIIRSFANIILRKLKKVMF